MISTLLDEQHIRRRRRSRRKSDHGRVLDRQPRFSFKPSVRARISLVLRVAALILIVAGLTTGLVMVGASDGFGTSVVSGSLERAEMNLTIPGPAADVASGVAQIPGEPANTEPGDGDIALSESPATADLPLVSGVVEFERNEDTDYVVAPGDTLSGIADRFDLKYDILAQYNGITDPDSLVPGQRLLIPSEDLVDDYGV